MLTRSAATQAVVPYRFEEVFDLSLPDGLAAMGLSLEALVPLPDLLAMPRPQLDGKREGESRREVARYPDFDLTIGRLERRNEQRREEVACIVLQHLPSPVILDGRPTRPWAHELVVSIKNRQRNGFDQGDARRTLPDVVELPIDHAHACRLTPSPMFRRGLDGVRVGAG